MRLSRRVAACRASHVVGGAVASVVAYRGKRHASINKLDMENIRLECFIIYE